MRCAVSLLRLGNLEITAVSGKKVVDLPVARYRGCTVRGAIYVDAVFAAFSKELTAMFLEVPDKVIALHAARSGKFSRMTF